jgi:hypothetical protein
MENSSVNRKKMSDFIEELITADRNDWDRYREDFVSILVKYGYRDYLYEEEEMWYKDNVEESEYCQSISSYW